MERSIYCPYCGETIKILVDSSVLPQQYTEDCQVCCRPIVFSVELESYLSWLILRMKRSKSHCRTQIHFKLAKTSIARFRPAPTSQIT
ncbi:CPXCG motif-containing cysteine-rich protein [Microbulbifer sp. ZKSA004]|uniref:CPXCG motif-containing cysteine-rich protein n=1 Tax=Microbulbifer sp. ZKSA004 TaxID=3243389 RepID=UPI004039C2B0